MRQQSRISSHQAFEKSTGLFILRHLVSDRNCGSTSVFLFTNLDNSSPEFPRRRRLPLCIQERHVVSLFGTRRLPTAPVKITGPRPGCVQLPISTGVYESD